MRGGLMGERYDGSIRLLTWPKLFFPHATRDRIYHAAKLPSYRLVQSYWAIIMIIYCDLRCTEAHSSVL